MTIILYFLIIAIACGATLLDTSYFSFLSVYSATILSSVAILISFSILNLRKWSVIYASFLTLFFAIFSSLPVWLLICLFFGLPLIILAVESRMALDRSKFLVIMTFIIANLLFQLSLVIASLDFSSAAFVSVISFVIINTLAGLVVFYLIKKIRIIASPILKKV